jgi:hypothetical protein
MCLTGEWINEAIIATSYSKGPAYLTFQTRILQKKRNTEDVTQ